MLKAPYFGNLERDAPLELGRRPSVTCRMHVDRDARHGQRLGTSLELLTLSRSLVGRLLDEHGREVGGLGKVAIAGTGLVIDLGPDERLNVPVVYGTASFRGDWGYLVPPGRYWVRTEVPFRRTLPGVPSKPSLCRRRSSR